MTADADTTASGTAAQPAKEQRQDDLHHDAHRQDQGDERSNPPPPADEDDEQPEPDEQPLEQRQSPEIRDGDELTLWCHRHLDDDLFADGKRHRDRRRSGGFDIGVDHRAGIGAVDQQHGRGLGAGLTDGGDPPMDQVHGRIDV